MARSSSAMSPAKYMRAAGSLQLCCCLIHLDEEARVDQLADAGWMATAAPRVTRRTRTEGRRGAGSGAAMTHANSAPDMTK
jgi:hypothetical protein